MRESNPLPNREEMSEILSEYDGNPKHYDDLLKTQIEERIRKAIGEFKLNTDKLKMGKLYTISDLEFLFDLRMEEGLEGLLQKFFDLETKWDKKGNKAIIIKEKKALRNKKGAEFYSSRLEILREYFSEQPYFTINQALEVINDSGINSFPVGKSTIQTMLSNMVKQGLLKLEIRPTNRYSFVQHPLGGSSSK